jgi:hypothetical protein
MVSRPACFHGNHATFLLCKKCKQLVPMQLAADHNLPNVIHSVNLENRHGCVEADYLDTHRGRLPFIGSHDPHLGTFV